MKKLLLNSKNRIVVFFAISLLFTGAITAQSSLTSRTLSSPSIFWLNLTSDNGVFNQMVVGYTVDATLGVDRGIDGLNFNPTNYLCSSIDGAPYTIQGRPAFSIEDVVNLCYNVTDVYNYLISIDHLNGLFDNQDIFLKDNLTNTIHDLKSGPYSFASEAGVFNSRFQIVYQNALAVNQSTFNGNSVVVYKQNQELVIDSGTTTLSNVKVFDVSGRLLISKNNIHASKTIIYTGTTREVLLVKITSDTDGIVTKKIIN